MKKYFVYGLLLLILLSLIFIIKGKNKQDNNLQKVRIAEVTHSLFYAPLYIAIENGYFEEEGLDIELVLTSGADKVAATVLSNDVEIGFAGPEATIYIYNGDEKDYLQTFAGLTKKDGQFIISRNKDFKLEDLKGKEVVVGRKGGMPAINFLNALYNHGIKEDDIKINYSVEFANLSGAFISGVGDYVNLFEPNATKIYEQGFGYIVASVGDLSSEVPYTAFFARKSYIENNKEIINKFRAALNKAIKYVYDTDVSILADNIFKQFPDTSINEIKQIINNYKEHDSWFSNTKIEEKYFINLEDMMIRYSLLDNYVNFNDLVINE